MSVTILQGDVREVLATLPDDHFDCCVTSPPYWGLRDYGAAGQIGLEPTLAEYLETMVGVCREVRRVLMPEGTFWLNIGDSYNNRTKVRTSSHQPSLNGFKDDNWAERAARGGVRMSSAAWLRIKEKDLCMVPNRLAIALQEDGWWVRQQLPWVKRNPMPESTRDRPTNAVEYVFQLCKSERYYFDYEGVKRRMAPASESRLAQDVENQAGSTRANGRAKTNGAMKAVRGDKQRGHSRRHAGFNDRWDAMERTEQRGERAFRNSDLFYDSLEAPFGAIADDNGFIALDVPTYPFAGAHFATMPARLAEPLIVATCPPGGRVLDPFGGAGTTALVADRLGRHATLIELNPQYIEIARRRINNDAPLLAEVM